MSRTRSLTRALIICVALLWSRSAVALPAPEASEPEAYAPTIAAALDEFELGNMAEARTLLLQAHQLFPNARTLRALGMTEFELKSYVAAVSYLEQALASEVRPLESDLRAETQALLTRARGFTGTVELRVVPAAAQVRLDGAELDPRQLPALLLPIGAHTLEVSADGHQRETRRIQVEGGRSQVVQVVLPALKRERPLRRNPWLWTGVAVVVAGAAVAGTLLALRAGDPSIEGANGGSTGAVLIGPTRGDSP